MKKHNFYFFAILSLFAKIISNDNFSLIKKFEDNIDTFKNILIEDTDITNEENKKKLNDALSSIKINTNAFFEADRTDTLDDSQLYAFVRYINQLYILQNQFFRRYTHEKILRAQQPLPANYFDLLIEKIEWKKKMKNVLKKKTLAKFLLYPYPTKSNFDKETKANRGVSDFILSSFSMNFENLPSYVPSESRIEVLKEISILDKGRGEKIKLLVAPPYKKSRPSIFSLYFIELLKQKFL